MWCNLNFIPRRILLWRIFHSIVWEEVVIIMKHCQLGPCIHFSVARVDKYMSSLQSDVQHLLDTLRVLERVQMTSEVGVASGNVTAGLAMLMDRVKQLTAHCNVILVNDSLRDWGVALDSQTSVLDTNAVSACVWFLFKVGSTNCLFICRLAD